MKTKVRVVLVVVLLAAGGVALALWRNGAADAGGLRLSGNIEATSVELAFQVPGRLLERPAREGAALAAGDLAARLDPADFALEVRAAEDELRAAEAAWRDLELGARVEELARAEAAASGARAALALLQAGARAEEIQGAEAELRRAAAVLAELENGSRPEEVARVEADLQARRADAERLRAEAGRLARLLAEGSATPSDAEAVAAQHAVAMAQVAGAEAGVALARQGVRAEVRDQARAARDAAAAHLALLRAGARPEELARAAAAVSEAEAAVALLRAGSRPQTIAQAKARHQAATAALDLARRRLDYTRLTTPLAAVVLVEHAEPGEFLAAGSPVVTVGDLAHPWVRAYLPETDLGRVRLGDPARVYTDSFPGRAFAGTVSLIAAEPEFTPREIQTERERVKLVYRMRITVANPDLLLKPGMPADVVLVAAPPPPLAAAPESARPAGVAPGTTSGE